MRKKDTHKTYYYDSFETDFVESPDQNYTLPEDYVWIRSDFLGRAERKILYALSRLFGRIYGALILHLTIVRNVDLCDYRDTGAVVYGNHTQPLGDVFTPTVVCAPKKCYTVAAAQNLTTPVIGHVLPILGALPIPNTTHGMAKFLDAIRTRLDEKVFLVVYPEAHVWPYYTKIRPFPATSFSFAVDNHVPVFAMTTTYQARRHGRPKTTVYLDGPFYPDEALPKGKQKKQLCERVYEQMQLRSEESNFEYIHYQPKEAEKNAEKDPGFE